MKINNISYYQYSNIDYLIKHSSRVCLFSTDKNVYHVATDEDSFKSTLSRLLEEVYGMKMTKNDPTTHDLIKACSRSFWLNPKVEINVSVEGV